AIALKAQGRMTEAAPLYREAVAMYRRLFPESQFPLGHPDLARSLNNQAAALAALEDLAGAAALHREALSMYQRLAAEFALVKSEGEALNFLNSLPAALDNYLS